MRHLVKAHLPRLPVARPRGCGCGVTPSVVAAWRPSLWLMLRSRLKLRLWQRRPCLRGPIFSLLMPALLAGCMVGPARTLGPDQEPQPALMPSTAAQTPQAPFAPRRVALVLSGGGLRGLAHLGVLRVLEQQGLRPDLIVGTSVGAVMGGAYASGTPVKDLEALPLPTTLDPWGSWLVTPRQRSAALEPFVASQLAHQRLEDFPVRFVAVATERRSGCVMLFGSGDAARAIMASSALPGALAPVAINGSVYVDGGLAAPLPVRIARALGADVVIAVDTTFHAAPVVPDGLVDSVFHAGMVMARNLAAADRLAADLVLDPMFPPVPEVTLRNSKRLVDAGALAALQQLAQLRMLFAPGPRAPKRPIGWEVAPVPLCSPAAGATPQGWQLSAQLQ